MSHLFKIVHNFFVETFGPKCNPAEGQASAVGGVPDVEAAHDEPGNLSTSPTTTTLWTLLVHLNPSNLHIHLLRAPNFAAASSPSSWYTVASGRITSQLQAVQRLGVCVQAMRIELAQFVNRHTERLILLLERQDEGQEAGQMRRTRDEMIEGVMRRWLVPAIQAVGVVALGVLALKAAFGVGWEGVVPETTTTSVGVGGSA